MLGEEDENGDEIGKEEERGKESVKICACVNANAYAGAIGIGVGAVSKSTLLKSISNVMSIPIPTILQFYSEDQLPPGMLVRT